MTVQTLAFTIVLLLFSSFSFAHEQKKFALTKCTCEYTIIYDNDDSETFSKIFYDALEFVDSAHSPEISEIKEKSKEALLEKCSNMVVSAPAFIEEKAIEEKAIEKMFYGIFNCKIKKGYQKSSLTSKYYYATY